MCGQIYLKYVHCTYCELGLLRGLEFMWVCASIFFKQFLKACSSDVPVIFMEKNRFMKGTKILKRKLNKAIHQSSSFFDDYF